MWDFMKKDIQETLIGKETFVLFYAPWCGFSRGFLPAFEEFSKTCSKECVIVDKVESPDLCKTFSINYYPTVIWFKNGKIFKRLDSKPGIGLNKEQLSIFSDDEQ